MTGFLKQFNWYVIGYLIIVVLGYYGLYKFFKGA